MVEYVLIITLIALSLVAVLTVTGPAIGNVFSNTVVNILDAPEARHTLSGTQFWRTVTAVWTMTPQQHGYSTGTKAPDTLVPTDKPTDTPENTVPSPTNTATATPGPSQTPTDTMFEIPFEDNIEDTNARDHFEVGGNNCSWAVTSEHFHSAANAWSDSPVISYQHGTDCVIMLRGAFDLTAASAPVHLTFWDRWHLKAYDRAQVEVQEYGSSGWTNVTTEDNGSLHYNNSNLAFIYETVDLSNWVGRKIRIRFRLDATSNQSTGDGWYIDDIRVFEANLKEHAFPFHDDVDSGGSCPQNDCWLPSGTWAISGEAVHGGNFAWSDSPGANYMDGSNTSLTLDGLIEIPSSAQNPTLRFWDRWHLRALDHAYVEISTEAAPTWVVKLDHFNDANLSWARESIDLSEYKGKKIRIRFRLDAMVNRTVGNGWWIDDIEISDTNLPVINSLPWIDKMESSGVWWIPEGTWALSSEAYNSSDTAWSDSPGANYINGSNSVLTLNAIVDLNAAGISNPELIFWDRYDLNNDDYAHVEISTDNGSSWTSVRSHHNETNLSWARTRVDLSAYANTQIRIRFRLDARAHAPVGDGWWIDDVELRAHNEQTITAPWCEDFEPGTTSWCNDTRNTNTWWLADGTWTLGNEAPPAASSCHSGNNCWSDSPGANYVHGSNASLTLNASIDIPSSMSKPILYYWQAYDLRGGDKGYVEVSTDEGATWKQADAAHSTDVMQNANVAWTRNQVSLRAYIGQKIMLRFRLDARENSRINDGWWIDDISIIDYNPRIYTLPFLDEAEPGYWPNWIAEGSWNVSNENPCNMPDCTPSNYSYTDSPDGDYIHNTNTSIILDGEIRLTGSTHPLMTFWRMRKLEARRDYMVVEITRDGGFTWRSCYNYSNSDNRWGSYYCDLSRYVSSGTIGLRFRLQALSSPTVRDGIWVDRIEIAD